MNLFDGLEKFGFTGDQELDITKEEKSREARKTAVSAVKKPLEEKDFLLDKKIKCPVCDKEFTSKIIKTGKLKRGTPDFDLKPNYDGIESAKYDVTLCPYCGYAALNKSFEHLSVNQMRSVRDQVCSKYRPSKEEETETYSYDQAMKRFQLALISSIAKHAKLSEKSYICLRAAWLLRAELKEMPENTDEEKALKKKKEIEYNEFYKQAYDGFSKALSSEMPPYYGLQTSTLEYMLANMAVYFKDYSTASKLVSNLIQGTATPSRIKDKAVDLKQEILKLLKEAEKSGK